MNGRSRKAVLIDVDVGKKKPWMKKSIREKALTGKSHDRDIEIPYDLDGDCSHNEKL